MRAEADKHCLWEVMEREGEFGGSGKEGGGGGEIHAW